MDDTACGATRAPCGHRALAHTADVRIKAWGTSRAECPEESVTALAELYVDVPPARRVVRLRPIGVVKA